MAPLMDPRLSSLGDTLNIRGLVTGRVDAPRAQTWWPPTLWLGNIAQFFGKCCERWSGLSLVHQFFATASIVLAIGMMTLGIIISARIDAGGLRNTAVATAFYMQSYVEPLVQSLAVGDVVPDPAQAALDQVLSETPLGQQLQMVNIATKSGTIVYSSAKGQVGKTMLPTMGFQLAVAGEVHARLESRPLHFNTSGVTPRSERPLKVYAPIHKLATNNVIGIAEFYVSAASVRKDISAARYLTLATVGGVTLVMLSALYGIIRRGSRTIAEQRASLEQRIAELSRLLGQNETLRQNIDHARRRVVETNERLMRRIGADLHDGPAQLIGITLLRMNELDPRSEDHSVEQRQKSYEFLQSTLRDSLEEIRTISADIAPPRLENATPAEAIALAVRNHEKLTGSTVETVLGELPDQASQQLKTCLYRFVQEGLTNAFRHAKGAGQHVEARVSGSSIVISVRDSGPGLNADAMQNSNGLGLAGLRDRVETLGGSLSLSSLPGQGTVISADLPCLVRG